MEPHTENSEGARAAFTRASALITAGDTETAESILRTALVKLPQDGNLLCLLGAVLVRQKRAGEAETVLRAVLTRFPDFAKAHEELGNALLSRGRLDEARSEFARTLELNPGNALVRHKLTQVLAALGEDDQNGGAMTTEPVLAPYEEALARAAKLRGSGETREAEAIYRELLARDRDDAKVYQLYGDLSAEQGQFGEAAVFYRRSVSVEPGRTSAWLSLGKALSELDEFEPAIDAGQHASQLEPRSPLPHLLIGACLSRLSRHADALGAYESALSIAPGDQRALLGLGHTQRALGRRDDAVATYGIAIERHPQSSHAYWSLANLKNYRFSDDHVAAMQSQLAGDSLSEEARTHLQFALGKACEDTQDYAQAFEYYARGNATRRKTEVYDAVANQELCDRLIDTFDRVFLDARADSGHRDDGPIFVVGLPRSGSTLIEQILASHQDVRGTRELPFLERIVARVARGGVYPQALHEYDAQALAGLGADYLAAAAPHRAGARFFTDKTPANFQSIGLLQLILPNAKIINARRHPLDSCLGSFKQLFASGQSYSYDLFELGEYYLDYQRLMDHWHGLVPGRILDVQYEEMVRDPVAQTRRLLEYCKLPWDDACLRFYETQRVIESASSEQVRQPLYTTSINNWRRFETSIGELVEILKPLLAQLPHDQRPG